MSFFTVTGKLGEVRRSRQCSIEGAPCWQLDEPCLLPPSQTTAWAIFSQDTKAAVLVLWPQPGSMWPGLTVGMGEGLADLVEGGVTLPLALHPFIRPSSMCRASPWVTSRRGTETCWRREEGGRMEWERETVEIDWVFASVNELYCKLN